MFYTAVEACQADVADWERPDGGPSPPDDEPSPSRRRRRRVGALVAAHRARRVRATRRRSDVDLDRRDRPGWTRAGGEGVPPGAGPHRRRRVDPRGTDRPPGPLATDRLGAPP